MRDILQTNVSRSEYDQNDVLIWELLHIFMIGFVFLPISMYGFYKYYKLRKKMVIKKRSARIVLLTTSLITFELFRRVWFFSYLTISVYSSSMKQPYYSCLFIINGILYPLLGHATTYSILWRVFVVYFKTNWTKSIINLKKIEENNGQYSPRLSVKKSFFIKYKANIGNVRINGKIFLLLYMISFITSAIIFECSLIGLISIIAAFIINSILLILPSLAIIYFWYKTPEINDNFYVRYELRIIAWITTIGLSLYILIAIFASMVNIIHYFGIISLIGAMQYVSYNIISLYFIIYKLEKDNILTIKKIDCSQKVDNDKTDKHEAVKINPNGPSSLSVAQKNKRRRLRTVSDVNDVITIIELNDVYKQKMDDSEPNLTLPEGPEINGANSHSASLTNDEIVIPSNEELVNSYTSINSTNSNITASNSQNTVCIEDENVEEKHNKDEIVIVFEEVDDDEAHSKNYRYKEKHDLSAAKINYHLVLQQILSYKKSYAAFLIHLSKEFSMECIFAFTELLQFKKYLEMDQLFMNQVSANNNQQNMDNESKMDESKIDNSKMDGSEVFVKPQRSLSVTDLLNDMSLHTRNYSSANCNNSGQSSTNKLSANNDIRDIISKIDLPSNIPNSSIIYKFENEMSDDDIADKCRKIRNIISKLSDKYIFGKGEYQINISYSIKSEFDGLIDSEEWIDNDSLSCHQLYTIFDKCIIEMFQLMTHSLRRFAKTTVGYNSFNVVSSICYKNKKPLKIYRNIRKLKIFCIVPSNQYIIHLLYTLYIHIYIRLCLDVSD